MADAQLLKGILEGCVLGIIAGGETYGYKLLAELEECGFDNLLEGTLYPVLTRLEKKGYIVCRRGKSPHGPVRKYYSITIDGKRYLDEFRVSFDRIMQSARNALRCAEGGTDPESKKLDKAQ